jgi:FkbM family methyltransferase
MKNNYLKQELLYQLQQVEKLAAGSKLSRLLHHPLHYLTAMSCRHFIYPVSKKGWKVSATTFWGRPFQVCLPAGTDIYLTGGKTDISEIRLAKFIIQQLSEGDSFIDVGSHFGFFSCLALRTMNYKGTVVAIEPSAAAYECLKVNLSGYSGANIINCLVGDHEGDQIFFEFPINYSEYNTAYPDQFKNSNWYSANHAIKKEVKSITLDSLCLNLKILPDIIKIDTEGSEYDIIKGALQTLNNKHSVKVVMEYLCESRNNKAHK